MIFIQNFKVIFRNNFLFDLQVGYSICNAIIRLQKVLCEFSQSDINLIINQNYKTCQRKENQSLILIYKFDIQSKFTTKFSTWKIFMIDGWKSFFDYLKNFFCFNIKFSCQDRRKLVKLNNIRNMVLKLLNLPKVVNVKHVSLKKNKSDLFESWGIIHSTVPLFNSK